SGHSARGAARRSAWAASQPMSPCMPSSRNCRKRRLVSAARSAAAKPTASNPSASAWSRIAAFVSSAALTPSTIGRHALIGHPQPVGHRAGLVEDIDRHAAARIPIAADAQPGGCDLPDQPLGDGEGAVLVEIAVIAKSAEEELKRLALDQPLAGDVIDHEMREVGL